MQEQYKGEFIMKVYVVTQGEYSDYHICGVAETMEKAQKLVKYFGRPNYPADIETYDTNTQRMLDKKWWKIIHKIPKQYGRVSTSVEEYDVYSTNGPCKESNTITYDERDNYCCYFAYITAKDNEHALKIFWDKLAEYIAKQQGIAL